MARIDRSLNRIADGYVVVGILGGFGFALAAAELHKVLDATGMAILVGAFLAWIIQVFIVVTLFRAGAEAIRLLRSIDRRLASSSPRVRLREEQDELEEEQDEVDELKNRAEGFLCSRCRFRVLPEHARCPGCGRRRDDLQAAAE